MLLVGFRSLGPLQLDKLLGHFVCGSLGENAQYGRTRFIHAYLPSQCAPACAISLQHYTRVTLLSVTLYGSLNFVENMYLSEEVARELHVHVSVM